MAGRLTRTIQLIVVIIVAAVQLAGSESLSNTSTNTTQGEHNPYKCKDGLFLPKWTPSEDIPLGDRVARAIVYFLSLCYMFLGVSIIADRFMSSIEVITAKEREVTVTKPTGEVVTLRVKIWNETVSNLTLMALGSSAPEIMLSALEIIGNDFDSGQLGPGTIVGSAAFNLFVIIAICIYVIPDDEVRRIKHLRVFFVTATWSIVAYLWLYIMIAAISPGVIQIWEGVVTLLLFPLTVFTSYLTDKYLLAAVTPKTYRPSRHHNVVIEGEGETDLEIAAYHSRTATLLRADRPQSAPMDPVSPEEVALLVDGDVENMNMMLGEGQILTQEILNFEELRKEYIDILRELRRNNPAMTMDMLEERARTEVLNRGPKSRAFYRIQATRRLTGAAGSLQKLYLEKEKSKGKKETEVPAKITTVSFHPAHYTVLENVGKFSVTVKREGGNLNHTVYVDYKTEDGTANAGNDYTFAQGTLTFLPRETEKSIPLNIIDDDVFEEDEHFYIKLGNVQFSTSDSDTKQIGGKDKGVALGTPAVATIMVLDDDHAGIIHFDSEVHETTESIGECHVKVKRAAGARGVIKVPYKTTDITAKAGIDYTATEGELVFENNEFEKYVTISINDSETYKKNVSLYLEIAEPVFIYRTHSLAAEDEALRLKDPNDMSEDDRVTEMGKPRLGDISKIEVVITESEQFRKTVDKMLDKGNTGALVGTSTWMEQFRQAITVSAGDDGDEGEEDKPPGYGDYIMHYLSLFWKLLFATVPPTDYGGGWWCFVASIVWIGILTGIIGDIARSFGCTIRLKDSVTAVTFVALGTSVPDTFASKVAAIGDRYADSSIGNVTGSNAVNVFLGIGVAWTIAAVVNRIRGQEFTMEAGNLAFSLTIYCAFALSAIFLLLARRSRFVGGELGGPKSIKIASSAYLVFLWLLYITITSLEAYDVIDGF